MLPRVQIPKCPCSPFPVASTLSHAPLCPLSRPKTTSTISSGTLAESAITLSPHVTFLPNTITPQSYHSHNVKPVFDSWLSLIQTFHKEITHIQFQQKMLADSLKFLQSCVDQLQKEYDESM